MKPRRIVLCVDDVGLSDAIDQALLALHAVGRASAGSVLVDGPSLPRSVVALRERAGAGLELGLHLNLTEPLAAAPAVRSLPALIGAAYVGRLDRAALRAEIDRQIDAYVALLGRPPDFVDGHQHVQQLPVVRELLLDAVRARAWPVAPWIRVARAPRWARSHAGARWADRQKARVVAWLGAAALARGARAAGLRTNGHLLGVRAFDADAARFTQALQAWLDAAVDGDLLMAHPALDAPAGDAIGPARAMELAVLAGPELGRMLRQQGITIAPMRAITG
ncbi:MAG: ChbG/HpnK family deacetylase [Burkholderiaceae bacterium]